MGIGLGRREDGNRAREEGDGNMAREEGGWEEG